MRDEMEERKDSKSLLTFVAKLLNGCKETFMEITCPLDSLLL